VAEEAEGRVGSPGDRWLTPGTLYIVGTPIGNRSDLSPRALEVLKSVDAVYAEDTRVSGPWLRRLGVTCPVASYHAHSPPERRQAILQQVAAGGTVALVTDAGMPGVSDPGQELVADAWREGIRVSAVPGPTAALTAFAVSGFPLPVTLWGFLPARGPLRRERAARIANDPGCHIVYEAPHRLAATLQLWADVGMAPTRTLLIARELTKLYEELWRGPLDAALERVRTVPPRGEHTLVVGPAVDTPSAVDWDDALSQVSRLVAQGRPPADACRQVARALRLPRRDLYRRWLRR
jgi:16S rRNA (cytidine1402-2'-O)-methyltransferase